ncbi:MAG: hypothetical protein HXS44_01430 [Theionarchaea archaeon]|nr:hypothetical protein [Theionarchaea archaeon]
MEVEISHILQQYFKKNGYEVVFPSLIRGRYRPDMLVTKGDEKLVIEVKRRLWDRDLIETAISQVLIYATYLENYEPFIASDLQPDNGLMDILKKYGIGYMWVAESDVKIYSSKIDKEVIGVVRNIVSISPRKDRELVSPALVRELEEMEGLQYYDEIEYFLRETYGTNKDLFSISLQTLEKLWERRYGKSEGYGRKSWNITKK